MMTERDLLIAELSAAAGLLRELTADVVAMDASKAPAPGEWAVIDVVRHLVEGDRDKLLPRLRRMLAEEQPVFTRNVQDPGDVSDLPTLVAAFASAREQVVKTLARLDPPGWSRTGVSPSRGSLSVETYAHSTTRHDTEHLRQIEAVRARLGLRPKRCEARLALTVPELVAALDPAARHFATAAAGLDEAQRRHRPASGDWARERDHGADAFEGSLDAFARARAETLAFLGALPEAAGERLGVSGIFGPISLLRYATHIADHDVEHLRQMRACAQAARARR